MWRCCVGPFRGGLARDFHPGRSTSDFHSNQRVLLRGRKNFLVSVRVINLGYHTMHIHKNSHITFRLSDWNGKTGGIPTCCRSVCGIFSHILSLPKRIKSLRKKINYFLFLNFCSTKYIDWIIRSDDRF